MKKRDAIELFGPGNRQLADAIGVTPARISQLPAILPTEYVDRILGAAIRHGIPMSKLRTIVPIKKNVQK